MASSYIAAATNSSNDMSPEHIAIIVAVPVALVIFVYVVSYCCRRQRAHEERAAAAMHPTLPSHSGPWSQQMQERNAREVVYYEEWLQSVLDQQLRQQRHRAPSKRRRGLRLVGTKAGATAAASQGDDRSPVGRSPRLRLATTPESRRPLRGSVSSDWKSGGTDNGQSIDTARIDSSVGLGLGLNMPQEVLETEADTNMLNKNTRHVQTS